MYSIWMEHVYSHLNVTEYLQFFVWSVTFWFQFTDVNVSFLIMTYCVKHHSWSKNVTSYLFFKVLRLVCRTEEDSFERATESGTSEFRIHANGSDRGRSRRYPFESAYSTLFFVLLIIQFKKEFQQKKKWVFNFRSFSNQPHCWQVLHTFTMNIKTKFYS